MTLRQLINKVIETGNFFGVASRLKDYYYFDESSEDIEYITHSYTSVIAELLEKPNFESSDRLVVEEKIDDLSEPPEKFVNVHISNDDRTDSRATDFAQWSTLIDLEIDNKLKLKPELLLAHILWELTFYGYSEDKINEESKKLQELCDRIDRGEEKLIPFEFDKVFKEPDE